MWSNSNHKGVEHIMNAKDCLLQRRSCRRFLDKPIDRETIRQMIDLARFAPSWKNTQIARYTVIDDPAFKNDIAENCVRGYTFNAKTIQRAAALAVISYETGLSGRDANGELQTPDAEKWEMFDAGVATQTFCLAARDDVGTCIIGVMDEDAIARKLQLSASQKIACLVAMGYPEAWKEGPARLACDELVTFI